MNQSKKRNGDTRCNKVEENTENQGPRMLLNILVTLIANMFNVGIFEQFNLFYETTAVKQHVNVHLDNSCHCCLC